VEDPGVLEKRMDPFGVDLEVSFYGECARSTIEAFEDIATSLCESSTTCGYASKSAATFLFFLLVGSKGEHQLTVETQINVGRSGRRYQCIALKVTLSI